MASEQLNKNANKKLVLSHAVHSNQTMYKQNIWLT
jgi:hypothetical protein